MRRGQSGSAVAESKFMRAQIAGFLVNIIGAIAISGIASAQIYVADAGNKRVGEYSMSGAAVNASLISGFNAPGSEGPLDVAIAGTNLYVLSIIFNGADGIGTIGKYNLDGTVVNASLITNITGYPQNLAISDTNIFVASGNSGVIGKYTTSGATINASLITGLNGPEQMAISGTNLFVAVFQGRTIAEYTTAGATVNPLLITNLGQVNGVAISGTNLFTAETSARRIGKYTTTGTVIANALISNLGSPRVLAISGTNLFVTDDSGNKVGEYGFSGTTNNATLISGLLFPYGIAVAPTFQSITPTNSAVILTWNAIEGRNYQVQYKTNLTQPGWINFLGPIMATTVTASASNHISVDPQRFYRVLFLP